MPRQAKESALTKAAKGAGKPVAALPDGETKKLNAVIDAGLFWQFKELAVARRVTLVSQLEDALREFIAKH